MSFKSTEEESSYQAGKDCQQGSGIVHSITLLQKNEGVIAKI